jgi:hypothetical protein
MYLTRQDTAEIKVEMYLTRQDTAEVKVERQTRNSMKKLAEDIVLFPTPCVAVTSCVLLSVCATSCRSIYESSQHSVALPALYVVLFISALNDNQLTYNFSQF